MAPDRRRDRLYAQFQALKDDGTVPEHLRFQVGLPFPSSALNAFEVDFAADYPSASVPFVDLVARELDRLTDAIPPADLAPSGTSATRCSTSKA